MESNTIEGGTIEQRIAQIEERLRVLEGAVFNKKERYAATARVQNKKSGPTRAILDLVDASFFTVKRTLGDVRAALEAGGYFYSAQAVDMSLSRLAHRDGSLVLLRVAGRKVYAERR